ncbi:MAG: 5'-nucleotidase C-terminal domain-containing protein, partial [Vicinamibacterales bacterium]
EASIDPDPAVADLVRQALAPYQEELSTVAGETATALNRSTMLESTMDNLLLQAVLESTGAQLAFSNGWRFGAPIIPGEVTLNDLYNMIPMNPPISTVELAFCFDNTARCSQGTENTPEAQALPRKMAIAAPLHASRVLF